CAARCCPPPRAGRPRRRPERPRRTPVGRRARTDPRAPRRRRERTLGPAVRLGRHGANGEYRADGQELTEDGVVADSVALVGFGYWGPNLARNLQNLAGPRWRYLVDASAERRERAAAQYPQVTVTGDLDQVLDDDAVTAVVLATPAATHAPLARRLLGAGKHVLVEKPRALSTDDAVALTRLAEERGLVLMVGHTFEFVPAVRKMKSIIDAGEIGEVLYLHSQRLNLGRIQSDI